MKWCALILFIFLAVAAAPAATLSDYANRVRTAMETADGLAAGPLDNATVERGVRRIRELVPRSESIEYVGGSVTTDNSGIYVTLDLLLAEPDQSKRLLALTSVTEQLNAIANAAEQIGPPVPGSRASREAEKQKLDEILKRSEYQKPVTPEESVFARWQKQFWEWLARVFPRPNVSPAPAAGMGSIRLGLQILIFLAIIGLIGFLLYKFVPALGGLRKEKKTKRSQNRTILGEQVSADETAEDLFSDAERLAREGQIRAAIRRAYIAALCDLGDRRVVNLAKYKTNRDYVRELRPHAAAYGMFVDLTGMFEQNWYGSRTSDASDWETFRSLYREILDKARSRTV